MGTSDDGWARVWSVDTAKPVTRKLAGSPGIAVPASVSAYGRMLAMGGADGAIRLWDLRDERLVGTALVGPAGGYVVAAFTPDGAFLIALTDTGRAYRWDMRPASWARHACAVAGRTLTRAEWQQALPGRDYEPACAG